MCGVGGKTFPERVGQIPPFLQVRGRTPDGFREFGACERGPHFWTPGEEFCSPGHNRRDDGEKRKPGGRQDPRKPPTRDGTSRIFAP